MNHLMIDLETMGNGPYAPVISIGAVFFDLKTGETGGDFSVNVSLESSMRYRARPDASTILWWMEQGEDARPDSKLHIDAMDYLSSKGLISVEDVLR